MPYDYSGTLACSHAHSACLRIHTLSVSVCILSFSFKKVLCDSSFYDRIQSNVICTFTLTYVLVHCCNNNNMNQMLADWNWLILLLPQHSCIWVCVRAFNCLLSGFIREKQAQYSLRFSLFTHEIHIL